MTQMSQFFNLASKGLFGLSYSVIFSFTEELTHVFDIRLQGFPPVGGKGRLGAKSVIVVKYFFN